MKVNIRDIEGIGEFKECVKLQKRTWGYDDHDLVPASELKIAQKNGGVVIGAFNQKNNLIGFCYGFVGIKDTEIIHCSRMVAVLPTYRNKGIARKLKLRQRKKVQSQNIEKITWTFDPLESLNAYLNIEKLGVRSNEYIENIYGRKKDKINWGLETDRLIATWLINSNRVKKILEGVNQKLDLNDIVKKNKIPVASVIDTNSKPIKIKAFNDRLKSPKILMEIPPNIQKVKRENINIAKKWRKIVRTFFLHYFNKGYVVDRFLTGIVGRRRRSFYLLEVKNRNA